jgi:L,D-transpeptidase YbiS
MTLPLGAATKTWRRAGSTAIVVALLVRAGAGYSLHEVGSGGASSPPDDAGRTVEAGDARLAAAADSLHRALAARRDRGVYVVIDRANNRLWVRTAETVRREAVVSTGSGTILQESGGRGRTWTFDTPPGRHQVRSERRNPVWVKPDWAFLEEGAQPPSSLKARREEGSLGEWALDLGDGYMIHGTLYERLLGRSITHGCVRVGRDDLRAVAEAVRPGTPVYIF